MRIARPFVLLSVALATPACVDDVPELGDNTAELQLGNFTVCHIPADDPSHPQTLNVGLLSYTLHIAHGDRSGACPVTCTPTGEACDGVDNDCDGLVDERCVIGWTWSDHDGDGLQGADEGAVADMTFVLRAGDGTVVDSTTSDERGYYTFAVVPPEVTFFVEVVPPGYLGPTLYDVGGDPDLDNDFREDYRTDDFELTPTEPIHLDCGLITHI